MNFGYYASGLSGDRRRPPKKKAERPNDAQEAPKAPERPQEGPFSVIMTREAIDGFRDLPGNVKRAMEQILERLRAWPEVSGVRSLFGKGYAANKFRMKTWDWRIEFLVDEQNRTITVTRVGHRDTFYDEYH